MAVTAIFLAADWSWWAYSVAGRGYLGNLRGHNHLGESTGHYILSEALWRLPGTLVSGVIGVAAVSYLLREQAEVVSPPRGFEHLRLYLAALILVMLVRVLVGAMLGVIGG